MSKVSDPLFILDTTKETYVPLNEDLNCRMDRFACEQVCLF